MKFQIDDPWGYRQKLQVALDKNHSENAVMAFVDCLVSNTEVSQEMKTKVIEHLKDAYDYVERDLKNCIDAVKTFRQRYMEADDVFDEVVLIEQILEMRCQVAVFHSLFENQIVNFVHKIDNELKKIVDLFASYQNFKKIKEWQKAMQKIGVNAWWLKLPD